MLASPLLSAFDPVVESEGSVDPLSLAPVYDRLADRILPALTVRMRRIRFVTAMCVAARVCSDYEIDDVATDDVTPPWLVFEWFVVEALVRHKDELDDADGVPGGLKVASARRRGHAVSHASYLKTPKVFGFSGIFRRFATQAGVLTDDLTLDDGGHAILAAWEADLGLDGFREGAASTVGGQLRDSLRKAVRAGMQAAATVPRPSDFWRGLARVMEPGAIKARERKALITQLVTTARPPQPGHASELVRAIIKRGSTIDPADEASVLRSVTRSASAELASCLRAIDAYEALCRPLLDTFDLLRALSTKIGGGPIDPSALAKHRLAAKLVARLGDGVRRIQDDANLGTWASSTLTLASTFAGVKSVPDLYQAVIAHHERAQNDKPPDGKRSWFERGRGDQVSIRQAYRIDAAPTLDDRYVHQYRTPTLSRFLRELKEVGA
jgi:hypothetical protein